MPEYIISGTGDLLPTPEEAVVGLTGLGRERRTLLSLDRYAAILGLDPLRLWGAVTTVRPPQNGCGDVWFEYDYQDGQRVSRTQLREAIRNAEKTLADVVSYWPGPTWVEAERIAWPLTRVLDYSAPLSTIYKYLTTHYGYVLSGGRQTMTKLATPTRLNDLDADGDNYEEWAVFQIAGVEPLDPQAVRAYFKPFDAQDAENTRTNPASTGADPTWEIRGLRAVLSGAVLTIYVPRWGLLRPDLRTRLDAETIDGDLDTNYVDTIEFYQEGIDTADCIELNWADASQATGTFLVHDQRLGHLQVAISSCTLRAVTEPSYARVWYRAGYPAQDTGGWSDELDDFWATNIAILATSRLYTPLCTCPTVQAKVDAWQANMVEQGQAQAFQIDPAFAKNPLGSRVGEVMVWQRLQGRGIKIGRATRMA